MDRQDRQGCPVRASGNFGNVLVTLAGLHCKQNSNKSERRTEKMESNQVSWSTFTVQLLKETCSGEWRGQVMHVQSGETRQFATQDQLEEFLHRHAPDFGAQGLSARLNKARRVPSP
jgi:hypothetical protein